MRCRAVGCCFFGAPNFNEFCSEHYAKLFPTGVGKNYDPDIPAAAARTLRTRRPPRVGPELQVREILEQTAKAARKERFAHLEGEDLSGYVISADSMGPIYYCRICAPRREATRGHLASAAHRAKQAKQVEMAGGWQKPDEPHAQCPVESWNTDATEAWWVTRDTKSGPAQPFCELCKRFIDRQHIGSASHRDQKSRYDAEQRVPQLPLQPLKPPGILAMKDCRNCAVEVLERHFR